MMNKEPKLVSITSGKLKENEQLLEQVFRQQEPVLRQFFRARLLSKQDSEDLVQELFLRLVRVDNLAERLSHASGSTQCYLLSIATNLIVDHKRRSTSRKLDHHNSYEEDCLPAEHPSPERVVSSGKELDRMVAVLKKLKPKCRRVFVMSRFKHMSHRDIAAEMGFSEASVERYIAIAMVALKKGLKS